MTAARGSRFSVGGSISSNIKVCVRVRPFSKRELAEAERCCARGADRTQITLADGAGEEKPFTFDRVLWSLNSEDKDFASQQVLMEDLGSGLKTDALNGYNSCLFAYGQTGSGKTFSVMGGSEPASRGVLPRILDETFAALESGKDALRARGVEAAPFSCSATFLEIYNEQLRDLLRPMSAEPRKLEIRSTPQIGTYIQGAHVNPVFSHADVLELLDFGAKNRSIASTSMNDRSSRSHCIFTLEIRRTAQKQDGTVTLRSKMNFVDLAGSERQKQAETSGDRLKEAGMINRSLAHLALVTSKLAEAAGSPKARAQREFIPFRNSKLTHLLCDSLGGNSRTVMLAAVSPAGSSYHETLSTLRFAQGVKAIKTRATKNEEPQGELVEQLRAECERLRAELEAGRGDHHHLASVEGLIDHYGRDVQQQLELAQELEVVRKQALREMGLTSLEINQSSGFDQFTPQLVNIATDPSLHGCLIYFLPLGEHVSVGCAESSKIRLAGVGIKPLMAVIDNEKNAEVCVQPIDGRVLVNGRRIQTRMRLRCGDRLIFGYAFCFRAVLSQSGEQAEMQGLEAQSVEHALSEVMAEESETYMQSRWYVEQLNSRIGATRVQVFLQEFTKVVVLVDEANAITKEVRPKDRFEFSVEVLVNLFKHNEEEPRCVVRLKKWEAGAARLKNVVRRSVLQRTQLERLTGDLKKRSAECKIEPDTHSTVAIMTFEAFRARVIHLREAYDVFSRHGPEAPELVQLEYDPWQEIHPWEVPARLHEHELAVLESCQRAGQQSAEKGQLDEISDMRIAVSELQEQAAQMAESHERERSAGQQAEAEKDQRILLLEQELAALRVSAQEEATDEGAWLTGSAASFPSVQGIDCISSVSGVPTSADLPTMLQHRLVRSGSRSLSLGGKLMSSASSTSGCPLGDAEETLGTAQLAHQVIRHLQDMKRDIRVQTMELELDSCVS